MAEAIISRGPFTDGGISDETKASVGLTSDATLDDVLQVLALRSDEYGTIVVTLKNPDGTLATGQRIQMIDGSDNILNYTTDEKGQCIFKTNSGQGTFTDIGYPTDYVDTNRASSKTVDCPVGSVKSCELSRYFKYSNGSKVTITSNKNIKFSNYINNINIVVYGGSGGGGINNAYINYVIYDATFESSGPGSKNGIMSVTNYNLVWNYRASTEKDAASNGGNGFVNIKNNFKPTVNKNYNCIIGAGGSYGRRSASYPQMWGARFNWFFNTPITGNVSSIVSNPTAGGTSFFGSEVSALGGGAGGINTTPSGGNGKKGGVGGVCRVTCGSTIKYQEDSESGWITLTTPNYFTSYGNSGTAGNIQLTLWYK